jgi:hypothetical protein
LAVCEPSLRVVRERPLPRIGKRPSQEAGGLETDGIEPELRRYHQYARSNRDGLRRMQTPQLHHHQKQEEADRQIRHQEVLPVLPLTHRT